jgi:hypothetical protein
MATETGSDTRVFDCFLFDSELDVLEWRLRTLDAVVDTFVVVEAAETFTRSRKPLHYDEGRDRFRDWSDRIVHIVPVLPDAGAWEREYAQRRAIVRGLSNARDGDVVLVSDVDEIPDPAVVASLKANPPSQPTTLAMKVYQLCVDLTEVRAPWAFPFHTLPFAACVRDLGDPEALREAGGVLGLPVIHPAGWHLSWLGSNDDVSHKLESFSHTELDTPAWKSFPHISRCRSLGVSPTTGRLLRRVDTAELPAAVQSAAIADPLWLAPAGAGRISVRAVAYCLHIPMRFILPARVLDAIPVAGWVVLLPFTVPYWLYTRARRRWGPRVRVSLSQWRSGSRNT